MVTYVSSMREHDEVEKPTFGKTASAGGVKTRDTKIIVLHNMRGGGINIKIGPFSCSD